MKAEVEYIKWSGCHNGNGNWIAGLKVEPRWFADYQSPCLPPCRQCNLPCSSHVFPNVWAEGEAHGGLHLVSHGEKAGKQDFSVFPRPEWQLQHHLGNKTLLRKCMSGVSVPVMRGWRRQLESRRRPFLLHLNVRAASGVDAIRRGQLCLSCLIRPGCTASVAAQLHVHGGQMK